MTIQVYWCEKQTAVVHWTIEGQWNWVHMRRALDATRKLGEAHKGRVDLVIDLREMGLPPANLIGGLRALTDMDLSFREGGINVLIGMDYYLKLLWSVLSIQMPMDWQIQCADSMAEAQAIIDKSRKQSNSGDNALKLVAPTQKSVTS